MRRSSDWSVVDSTAVDDVVEPGWVRWKVVAGGLALVCAAGYWFVGGQGPRAAGLRVTGTMEATQVDIGAKTTARIRAILVEEGRLVRRDDLIVELDSDELRADVARLEAAVRLARSQLEDLQAGARREEIAEAQAAAIRAEAMLADLEAGARPEDLAVAREAVAQAEARLRDLQVGARREEVGAARQMVAQAEARLRDLQAGARAQEIEQARNALASTVATRTMAQKEYDRFDRLFRGGLVAAQERDRSWQAYEVARAQEENQRQQLDLLLAGPRPEQLEAGRAEVRQAREQLALLEAGPRPDQVEAARAEVRQAGERVALLQAGPRPNQVEAARAEVRQVRQRLALLQAGPRPGQVQSALAQIAQAEAALLQAHTRLADAHVRAPIDGVVLRKNLEPGATVTPGTPVLTLMDPEKLWLRVFVPEPDVVRLRLGQEARISVDGLRDQTFAGVVSEIAGAAEFTPRNVQTQKERVNLIFRAKITIANPDGRLKPGIPADAIIAVE